MSRVRDDVEALAERRDAGEAEPRGDRPLVHLAALEERVVLGVDGDEAAAHLDVLQGAARERGGGQRPAVVAEADRAGRAELAHLGELLAREAARDGGEEPDGDRGLGAGRLDEAHEDRRRVDHRIGVGHGEDGHVAAGRGGRRAGRDVLFVLAPRRAQVRVQVDEAGQHEHAAGVDDARVLARLEVLADARRSCPC